MMRTNRILSFWISVLALTVMLTAAGCAGSAGTSRAPGARRAPGPEEIYAGMWEGTFDITMVAGGLSLVLNYEEGQWSGEVLFFVEGESVSGAVERFEVTDEGCFFTTYVQEADASFKASVEEGVMKGSMTVSAGGEQIDGSFVLTKK